jgi:GH25 family lysozyme M1 (1,4-beta-N-acetylmuramidase)
MLNRGDDFLQKVKTAKKEYTPIASYKPSGNLVYNEEMLNKIKEKFHM